MNHKKDQDDQSLARSAAEALRRSENIDSHTAAKLRAAREHALAAADTPSFTRRVLLPATAFAAMAMVTVLLMVPRQHQQSSPLTGDAQNIDALELLTDDMSPAFYHDLEFYRWLEQQRPHA